VPVSFPVSWDDLDAVSPRDFTVHTALKALGDRDPWAEQMVAPQRMSAELIEEGHAIPVARVQAMHEGKRRRRAKAQAETQAGSSPKEG
jgi:bifunctional non-homologous end joining protein LigD